MEKHCRLIWVSLTPEMDDRERRTLDLFNEHEAVVLPSEQAANTFGFERSDLVVLNSSGIHEDATRLIEKLDAEVAGLRILVRCRLTERPLDLIRRFPGLGVLDAEEGPAITRARLARAFLERKPAVTQTPSIPEWRRRLIGQSHEMQKVAEIVRLVGPRRCTVLITGETGTGKELIARAIHEAGPRASKPFVAVNCSAIPPALLEAELFGHTRGAFTGAAQSRIGRFEQAGHGTIFLDEIGELPLELQAKLLRVLQEREFQRLGSSETVRVEARVVAATNCSLQARAAEGSFRADLFYRLNVVPLEMPPLRARASDVRLLGEHFLLKACSDEQLPPKRITPQAWHALEQYCWPGNVRQLENCISSAVILSGDRLFLDDDDFTLPDFAEPMTVRRTLGPMLLPTDGLDFTKTVEALERNLLLQALDKTGGNKKAAAEMLQLKRTTLSAKIRVLELARNYA